MLAAILIVALWAALIVIAFALCRSAGEADERIEEFHRGPSGWRHG